MSELPDNLTTRWGKGEFETAGSQNIRIDFRPLQVNELNICEDCQKVVDYNTKNLN